VRDSSARLKWEPPDVHDVAKLRQVLWNSETAGQKVWAVLDAAKDRRIYGAVDGYGGEKCCLYAGTLPWQLQMAAPYLVELDPQDRFSDLILQQGWGNDWGILLHAGSTLTHIRKHLRRFLRVRDESGRKLIFRYYDPRVLRVYLPTCWAEELRTFFGPISRFVIEGEDPSEALDFTLDGVRLIQKSTAIYAARRGRS
jgi:hypothetical protein